MNERFGQDTASAVIGLSLERCCLYPGEMMQAAACLEIGCSSGQILQKIESGEIDCPDPFDPTE